jgi:hypothetical protein
VLSKSFVYNKGNKSKHMLSRKVQLGPGTVEVNQDLGFGHAGTVWDGALTLIAFLNKNYENLKTVF